MIRPRQLRPDLIVPMASYELDKCRMILVWPQVKGNVILPTDNINMNVIDNGDCNDLAGPVQAQLEKSMRMDGWDFDKYPNCDYCIIDIIAFPEQRRERRKK